MRAPVTPTQLARMAVRDANRYQKTNADKPISWRDALSSGERKAAFLKGEEQAEERARYAEVFAARLVERGLARPKGSKAPGTPGKTVLPRRLFSAPAEVFEAIDRAAKEAETSGNQWILAAVEEKLKRG